MTLSANQRSVIRQLDAVQFQQLGCIETVAIRMCRPSREGLRPALVERSPQGFRLTANGAHVKGTLV